MDVEDSVMDKRTGCKETDTLAKEQYAKGAIGFSDLDLGKQLYNCYLNTRDEKYKKALEQMIFQMNVELQSEWKKFCENNDSDKITWVNRLQKAMPCYMAYETAFHNKENYSDIVDTFQKADQYLALEETFSLHIASIYAMTLIDTLDVMSKEIFEHYKTLETLCKTSIKQILKHIKNENKLIYQSIDKSEIDDSILSDLARVTYVILKACRLKVLLPEKYQTTGMDLLDYIICGVDNTKEVECEFRAISILAYAEKLMLESN